MIAARTLPLRPSISAIAFAPIRRRSIRLATILIVGVAAVLLLPIWLPSPSASDFNELSQAPSWSHIFGTDDLGRDVFTRVIWGARVSWLVGASAALFSLLLGGFVGMVAAVSGKFVDNILMRFIDVVLAFPGILLAIVLSTAIGPGLRTLVIVVSLVYAGPVARFVRGLVRKEMSQEYVEAAIMIGSSRKRVLAYHVTINVIAPILVYQMTIAADAVLVEAGLSFLGAGVNPPTPAWGSMISEGQPLVFAGVWWLTTFAGLAIALTAVVLNSLADSILDELSLER